MGATLMGRTLDPAKLLPFSDQSLSKFDIRADGSNPFQELVVLYHLQLFGLSGRRAFNDDIDRLLQHRPEPSAFLPEDNVVIERARLEWTKLDGEGCKLARGKSIAARDAEARGYIVYLLADDIYLNCQMRLLAHVAQRIFVHLV